MQGEIEPMHGKIEMNIETDIEMNIPAGGGVPHLNQMGAYRRGPDGGWSGVNWKARWGQGG